MKKLLITSMAAVAVSICAKAEFTDTSEDFESKNIGPLFEQGGVGTADEGKYIVGTEWSTAATPDDGVFTVTNIADITTKDGYTLADGNNRALAIDTSTSLMRNAVTSVDASQTGYAMTNDESIFFDSLVQFTATESIPTPSTGDKLVIGLFADEDPEVNADLGALDNATNLVVISAVLDQNGEIIANATNIIDNTDLNVGPEEWHRLTIQVMNNSGFDDNVNVPGFKVFVDEEEVKVNGENKIFHSLVKFVNSGNVLKGVAFEGKGAVDDLVFTTTAPEFAEGGGDSDNANVCISINNLDAIDFENVGVTLYVNPDTDDETESDEHEITTVSTNILLKVGDAIKLEFGIVDGYTLDNSTGATFEEGIYIVEYSELTSSGATIEIVATSTGGGDNGPTVDGNSYATGEALKAVVKSDTEITVPSNWTVDGKVLKKADGTTFATFEYYNLTQNGNTVTATLDQKAAAPFAEATEGQEVLDLDATMDDGETPAVGIRIKTYSGLWYGLGTAAELGTSSSWTGPVSWTQSDSDGKVIQLKAAKEGDTRFYRIEVKDINPAPAQ